MKKRIIASLLCALMLLALLGGCGGATSEAPAAEEEAAPASAGEADSSAAQEDAAEGEVKKIVFAFPTWTGTPPDLQMVQDAMNEISRAEIGVEAELLVIDFASYIQQIPLMMSGNEQLDIISTLENLYLPAIMNGQLLDMEQDDLIQTYGQGIYEEVGEVYIDACRINGVLYGLPNNRDMAMGKGASAVRTDLLEQIGYEFKNEGEIEYITQEEMDDIFAKIHEADPGIEVYRPLLGTMQSYSTFDMLGGNVFGVLENYGETTEVVNLFETDGYREYCERLYEYNQLGYIGKDAATDTTAQGELVKAGTVACFTCGAKPGIKVQLTKECGRDMTIIQVNEDFTASDFVANFPWAIPQNSPDPVAAMQYLNLMYTNADMMNLITWGIEGEHYKVLDDGTVDFADGVDGTTSGYNHDMSWLFPNQFLTYPWTGNSPDLWNQMREFNSNAKKTVALGFSFDVSELSTEMTSVQNLYEEYRKSLEYGIVDPATGLPELIEKMEAAGLPKIIEAKQTQLDAWMAAKAE